MAASTPSSDQQCFQISRVEDLAEALAVGPDILASLAEENPAGYRLRVRRSSGKKRLIEVPPKSLKKMQARVARFLEPSLRSPIAFGIAGRNQFQAAAVHAQKPFVRREDIQHFFPSVRSTRVHAALNGIGFDGEPADLLVAITCYHGHLPTGAPS